MQAVANRATGPKGLVRGPQNVVSGLVLMALSVFAIWLVSDLPQGTLRAMGPAMLPRWLAIGVGLCGLALFLTGLLRSGDALEGITFRGPVFVVIGILAFAITIRGLTYGPIAIPGLGMVVAGPLAIVIGGFATAEARLRDNLILALALTAFCMVLFGDLLNLPIPIYPLWFSELFPAGWSNDARLRTTAGVLVLAAVLIYAATHRTARRDEPVDVADHSALHGRERI